MIQLQFPLIPLEQKGPSIALLDEPRSLDAFAGAHYTPYPNQALSEFVASHRTATQGRVVEPLPENLIAGKNTYIYDAHTYHTKVPPQAIIRLIEHYTEPGEIVLDPFCGSGMMGVAALLTRRKPVLIDLSPAATFIALNYLTPVEEHRYRQAIEHILTMADEAEKLLYGTHCRTCGKLVPMEYMVWSYGLLCPFCQMEFILWDVARDERENVRESKIKTEFECPHCGKPLQKRKLKRTRLYPVQIGYRCCDSGQQESRAVPDEHDLNTICTADSLGVPSQLWYPTARFPNGVNTRQAIAHGFETVDSLYTTRNLHAIAWLWDIARRWPDQEIGLKLMFTVTSLYQRVTRLSEFRFWGGSGNIANYNIPMIFNEQNVFRVFDRKARTIRSYLTTWRRQPDVPFCISTQSATALRSIPDDSIDYIFTDPPFGGNINYSEMNYLWEAWLGVFTETREEAIINRAQGKTVEEYRLLMTQALSEMHRVLKPGHWLTLVFHNSSSKVWSAIQSALHSSGFRVEKTQTLDKRHGTFKQFVSENAVGYDLILHCQKHLGERPGFSSPQARVVRTNVREFVEHVIVQNPTDFVVHYLHVRRPSELDCRKLYSLWLQACMEAGEAVDLDYEDFRTIISHVVPSGFPMKRLLEEESTYMIRPKTLPAFSEAEFAQAHILLASRVATLMGRKFEEEDWLYVYCMAKNLPLSRWSNLNIDVMYRGLGVEQKMLCVRSDKSIKEYCGTRLMHPAATRSIRIPSIERDATETAREVLRQYAALIRNRYQKVAETAPDAEPDIRIGWLLWQESLKEFLYFEERMVEPNPDDYWAEWKESSGGVRKPSKNLWVYEVETGRKRYSITTTAGAKIQPYFDVPAPNDPNLYYFCVQGEEVGPGLVRIWITQTTARLLKQVVGSLDQDIISSAIIKAAKAAEIGERKETQPTPLDLAEPILVTTEAYRALTEAFPGVSDEHMIQLFIQCL